MRSKCTFVGANHFAVLLGLAAAFGGVRPAEAALTCTSEPMIIACFEAYKVDVLPIHKKQLDAIVDTIERTRDLKRPLNKITLIGHSSKFRQSDPVNENARQRAQSVARALRQRLTKRGIDGVLIVTAHRGIRSPRTTNSTRNGRALNRRVEVFLDNKYTLKSDVRPLNDRCRNRGGRPRLRTVRDFDGACTASSRARALCRSEVPMPAGASLIGAACHPAEVHCVVCERTLR